MQLFGEVVGGGGGETESSRCCFCFFSQEKAKENVCGNSNRTTKFTKRNQRRRLHGYIVSERPLISSARHFTQTVHFKHSIFHFDVREIQEVDCTRSDYTVALANSSRRHFVSGANPVSMRAWQIRKSSSLPVFDQKRAFQTLPYFPPLLGYESK